MKESRGDSEATRALTSILLGRDQDGAPRFSEEDVLHYLPLLFIQSARGNAELADTPHVQRFLGEFAARIGVGPDTSPQEATKKIAAHYVAHPVNAALKTAFEQALREQTASAAAEALNQLAQFESVRTKPEGYRADRPPQEGTLPAGPLARFQAPGVLGNKNRGG